MGVVRQDGSSDAGMPCRVDTPIPLFDLQRQYEPIRDQILAALTRVCDSGQYVLGDECQQLEEALSRFCRADHSIVCASGSDALLLALMAFGIGPNDEVIMPSYTFFATAGAVARLGARPVFADIDPETFNIDPAQIEQHITPRTKAIMPVHLFGQCAEMAPILEIARKHGLAVIEDAAQAIGAEYHGAQAGTLGDVGCFSFYPSKNLGGMGDGGFMTATDDALAARLRILRVHGEKSRYHHQLVGINSRLDTFQAAVLGVKLPHLEQWTEARRINAQRYDHLLRSWGLEEHLSWPTARPHCKHVWNQYIIRVEASRRDALRQHLANHQIGTQIYYPVPMHEQECFASLGYEFGSLPETERAARESIALPIFPELREDEQRVVVQRVGEFFGVPAPRDGGHRLAGPNFLRLGNSVRQTSEGSEAA